VTALPLYVDRKMLQEETGLSRAAIDAVFRECETMVLPGCRKVFVRRQDVAELFERSTLRDGAGVR
jgi:hypothetical protein